MPSIMNTSVTESPSLAESQADETSQGTALIGSRSTVGPPPASPDFTQKRTKKLDRTQKDNGESKIKNRIVTPLLDSDESGEGNLSDSNFPQLTLSESHGSSSTLLDYCPVSKSRGQWANKTEMILTSLAYVGGFGDVWDFPFLALTHGQGTFIFLFLALHLVLAFPLVYMELVVGQFTSMGPIPVFTNLVPVFRGLGWGIICVCVVRCIYYNVVMAWATFYLVSSIVPLWKSCNESYTTDCCLATPGPFPSNCSSVAILDRFSSHQFFYGYMYNYEDDVSGLGHSQWHLSLCLLFCWFLTLGCAIRGVQSFGIIVYFSATLPLVILFILFIFSTTLPNAGRGVSFFVRPSTTALGDPLVWARAGIHVLFSVSPANGVWMTLGSYNPFSNNCFRDAGLMVASNALISLTSGFTISSLLGFTAGVFNVSASELLAHSGYDLAFVVVPQGLLQHSGGLGVTVVTSVLFFLMLMLIGLNSQFIKVETAAVAICDQWPRLRKRRWAVVVALCCALFLLGLPLCTQRGSILFSFLADYVNDPLMYLALLELVCVAHIYGWRKTSLNIRRMIKQSQYFIFRSFGSSGVVIQWMWFAFCPSILAIFLALYFASYSDNILEPSGWLNVLGSFLVFLPLMIICVFASVAVISKLRRTKPLRELVRATNQWCAAHKRPLKRKPKTKSSQSAQLDLVKGS